MPLSPAETRALKSRAQLLEPAVRLGREGATEAFYRALDQALTRHGLVKIKFAGFKEEKKSLAPEIAARAGAELIARVGNVAVYYRATPPPAAESQAENAL